MRYLIIVVFVIIGHHSTLAQDSLSANSVIRNNALYLELAGRGYLSLNYDRAWGAKNRINFGFGSNHMETYLDSLESIEMGIDEDHEAFLYLLLNAQYSRLFGKGPHYLELGVGVVVTLFDLERLEFANNLYKNEAYISVYPLVGYRYEGAKGFLFMASFNPLIEIPHGYFWPIPGISFGYRF